MLNLIQVFKGHNKYYLKFIYNNGSYWSRNGYYSIDNAISEIEEEINKEVTKIPENNLLFIMEV